MRTASRNIETDHRLRLLEIRQPARLHLKTSRSGGGPPRRDKRKQTLLKWEDVFIIFRAKKLHHLVKMSDKLPELGSRLL